MSFDWKSLGESLAKLGLPLLGAALPIPGGAALGTALAAAIGSPSTNPQDILTTLSANADALAKAKQFEQQHAETMLKITVEAETQRIDSVNKTLQTEAMGGSYWQRNHHGIECTLSVLWVIAVYFGLPLFHIAVPAIPETAFMMVGSILGVTAWQRGQANAITASSSKP